VRAWSRRPSAACRRSSASIGSAGTRELAGRRAAGARQGGRTAACRPPRGRRDSPPREPRGDDAGRAGRDSTASSALPEPSDARDAPARREPHSPGSDRFDRDGKEPSAARAGWCGSGHRSPRAVRAPHREETPLGLRRGDAGQGPNLGIGELPASEGVGESRQRAQRPGDANPLARCARLEADSPGEPLRARAEARVPPAADVELSDERAQPCGGRVEVGGQLGDLSPRRSSSATRGDVATTTAVALSDMGESSFCS
jgi:hypothetical protein